MDPILIVLCVVVGLVLLTMLVSFYCFMRVFYAPRQKEPGKDEYPMPPGDEYIPFHGKLRESMKQMREMEHTNHEITSRDGLKLCAKLYEYAPDAPIEILFHGYKGTAERDLCVGVERCFSLGHSAFIVDQRGAGKSEGRVITFGIKERYDCVDWANYVARVAPGRSIMIGGISMGAATVMLASELELPECVVGVLADCGYNSSREIISLIVKQMHLPVRLVFPFIKLGGLIFGGFNIDERTPRDAVANSRLPIIFFHGDADGFVPCYMSEDNYNACTSRKALVITKGADHGLCFLVDPEQYLTALREFYVDETVRG